MQGHLLSNLDKCSPVGRFSSRVCANFAAHLGANFAAQFGAKFAAQFGIAPFTVGIHAIGISLTTIVIRDVHVHIHVVRHVELVFVNLVLVHLGISAEISQRTPQYLLALQDTACHTKQLGVRGAGAVPSVAIRPVARGVATPVVAVAFALPSPAPRAWDTPPTVAAPLHGGGRMRQRGEAPGTLEQNGYSVQQFRIASIRLSCKGLELRPGRFLSSLIQ